MASHRYYIGTLANKAASQQKLKATPQARKHLQSNYNIERRFAITE